MTNIHEYINIDQTKIDDDQLPQDPKKGRLEMEIQPYYGRLKLICSDANNIPRYMLGPHYPLFFTAFIVCASLIGLLFYSYFFRFTTFWKVMISLTSGAFLISYIKVGFSKPGIAHAKRHPTSLQRQSIRFCHICEIVRQRKTEHCEDCGVCIIQLDHHCPWVGKCIGKQNLLDFYIFLGLTFGNMIICFVATSATAIIQVKGNA